MLRHCVRTNSVNNSSCKPKQHVLAQPEVTASIFNDALNIFDGLKATYYANPQQIWNLLQQIWNLLRTFICCAFTQLVALRLSKDFFIPQLQSSSSKYEHEEIFLQKTFLNDMVPEKQRPWY